MSAEGSVPARVLAVGAHPDDIEIGCGATLAKWAAAGAAVHLLVCTDGSKGTWERHADPAVLSAARKREQQEAAAVLGASREVVFLGRTDGELRSDLEARREICGWIRELRPEVVLGHDPWARYRLHPDHREAGFLVTDGVVAARDQSYYPDVGAEPHRPGRLLLWEAEEPDHAEDVGGFGDTKVRALLEHKSQLRSTMGISDERSATQIETFRRKVLGALAEAGRPHGLGPAEAFRVIDQI